MSEDNRVNKENRIFHGELSGSMHGLHAGTYMADIKERLAELRKEREKSHDEILKLVEATIDHFSGIIDQIKEIDRALEATAKLKKLHEQGKLDLANPDHLVLFETAKFDPADYNPDGGIAQFTQHTETLEEARRRLVEKASEIANSNDPDLVKDERFQSLRREFEQIKDRHNADHLNFHNHILREVKDKNLDNSFAVKQHDIGMENAFTGETDQAFRPDLKGLAKQEFTAAARNLLDFGEPKADQVLTSANVKEENNIETPPEANSFVQKLTLDFG